MSWRNIAAMKTPNRIARVLMLMKIVLSCICCLLLSLGCAQRNGIGTCLSSDQSNAFAQGKLCGAWTSRKVEASYPEWRNAEAYQLFVYEDKTLDAVPPNLPGNLVVAEFVVVKQDGTSGLVPDTQPVFATRTNIFFGPIGSCYQFGYELSGSSLKLDLHTQDGGWVRLFFDRTAADPGKPRFPEISERWR
jgi:hypothetical protein